MTEQPLCQDIYLINFACAVDWQKFWLPVEAACTSFKAHRNPFLHPKWKAPKGGGRERDCSQVEPEDRAFYGWGWGPCWRSASWNSSFSPFLAAFACHLQSLCSSLRLLMGCLAGSIMWNNSLIEWSCSWTGINLIHTLPPLAEIPYLWKSGRRVER